jgi:hypothetical protein
MALESVDQARQMDALLTWIVNNKEWVFSGVGAAVSAAFLAWFLQRKRQPTAGVQQTVRAGDASRNIQAGRDVNIWPATGSDSTASSNILKDLERLMGDLFDAMQADLKAAPLVREFYALSSKNQMINTLTPRFVYNATDIPDLVAKVRILENQGLVRDATLADVPIYWMSEKFVSYLTKRGAR